MVPRSVNVDGYRYVLDDDEVKMLKEKFKEIYNEYVKQNVDIAEEK
jgi:acyl-[acyl carrier protein]--UDP-N-acetylglucosamine O-acyltransferase